MKANKGFQFQPVSKNDLEQVQNLYAKEMLNLEQAYRKSTLQDKDTKHNVNKLLFEVMEMLFV